MYCVHVCVNVCVSTHTCHVQTRGQLQVLFLWCHVAFFLDAMCSWRFVCTCAYMHLVLHAHKYLYMHRPETNTVLSHSPPYTFWDRDSHWTWSSSVHPVWLSSRVWGLLTPPPVLLIVKSFLSLPCPTRSTLFLCLYLILDIWGLID